MASPPSGYNLSKKRPSISGPLPANPSKRRKPSTGPSGLRQTSFPPEESGRAEFSRSPSVDSTYTTNTNTTRKKGRKGKGGDDDVRSTTGTSVRGGKAGGGDGADKADEEEEADQEEGGEALDAVLEGQGEADEKQEKEHLRMLVDRLDPDQSDRYAKYRAVKLKKETVRKITNQTLSQSVPQSVVTTINSYTKVFIGSLIERARTVQQEWQAVAEYAPIDDPRLPANQQPSPQQQAPTPAPQQQPQAPPPPSPAPAQTPGAYHNPYGYQHLHPSYNPNPYSNIRIPPPPSASTSPAPPAAAHPPSSPAVAPSGTPSPAPGAAAAPTTNGTANPNPSQTPTPNASQDTTVPASSGGTATTNTTDGSGSDSKAGKPIPPDTPLSERLAERDRGPLTPDHLREALRRYKKDREGGAMGFLGLSLEGRERTAGRMGGRRLFK
ncbi:putative ankyrin-like protein [Lasiodiplodia theobromae]|uniref:TAFII28-like protein domain-containing protein n=3 Tax=Lasiodiplodia TaxID=66739 RepID=A0A5N5DIG6_9PEZI|nr:hypothetical protein DBV05_g4579 [Lasiodiplodia theobromae]KAF9636964.1 putative ankyrin-like protein [Lasiodiplodia theobromae]KAK0650972.1 hypothetical protein DIS24_g6390 [Lasiodiplodia hormozganensis]